MNGLNFRCCRWTVFIIIGCAIHTGCLAVDWSIPVLFEQPDPPDFPRSMLKSKSKGTVVIRAAIDSSGRVINAALIQSNGFDALNAFIAEWVLNWKYLPRLESDRPVPGFTVITVRFDLETRQFQVPEPIDEAFVIPDGLLNILMDEGIPKQNRHVFGDVPGESSKSEMHRLHV
ncbi:TonB family protein [bacterium]|nr:TonB family protein [candidate division CSSED10-310 bacterium]